MKILLFLTLSFVIFGQVSAQVSATDSISTLPPPPWLRKAPAMSHWVITYAQSSESPTSTADGSGPDSSNTGSAKKVPPKIIEVTKTGKTILEKLTTSNGSESQIWRKNGYVLTKNSQTKNWFVGPIPAPNDPFEETDYSATDFAGFAWINAQNFTGIQVVEGGKCLVFRDKVLAISAPDLAALKDYTDRLARQAIQANPKQMQPPVENMDLSKYKVEVVASIDLSTLLPASLKVGTVTRTYKFLPPPSVDLELPEDAQLALDNFRKRIKAAMEISAGRP